MTIVDHIKTARAHEQATADLRVAAFQNYQAAGRSNDNGDYTVYEAARSSHIAACEAVRLISAAPDLLAQLQSIRVELEAQALGYTAMEIWPHVRAEMIRRILLTIAKAEGNA